MSSPLYRFTSGTAEAAESLLPLAGGLAFSRLALGCMHHGVGPDLRPTTVEAAFPLALEVTETALELGWNFFDHADIYGRGQSERVFGKVVRELGLPRESIVVQSKCGIRFAGDPGPSAPHRFDASREYIISSAEQCLERLQMDYLDIFLLHRPDLLVEPEEVLAAFDQLRTEGKVRHFGVSNCPPALLDLFAAAGFVPVLNQIELNLLRTSLLDTSVVADGRLPAEGHPADGTLEWHRRQGVLTQAWAPMAYGYLSGRKADWDVEKVQAASAEVAAIAAAHGVPPEAIVIAWLLRHPAGVQPVIGTRNIDRLRACDAARGVQLSREDWYRLYIAGRGRALP
jgi:predicted oxidoreductase